MSRHFAGNNGTIDGQGSVWWEQFDAHALNYSRPHLIEFVSSSDVVISNLTILNAPAWSIHPAYCRYFFQYILVLVSLSLKFMDSRYDWYLVDISELFNILQ